MAFKYKGISADNFFIVEKIERSLLPPISHTLIEIAKRPGAVHQQTVLGVRKETFTIRIRQQSTEFLNEAIRTVAHWLYAEEPQELEIEKEPDLYYWAVLDGETDLTELVNVGKTTLSFICTDPIAYNRTEEVHTLTAEYNPIEIKGTYKTFPRLKFTFTQDVTFFGYLGPNETDQVILGKPINQEDLETPVMQNELIYDTTMDNLEGWSTAGTVLDGGINAGEMITKTSHFTHNGIGTGTEWHGPAIKRGLPEVLDNYMIEVYLNFKLFDPAQLARAEVYLLDPNGTMIGKMALADYFKGARDTFAEFRAGNLVENHYFMNTHGAHPGVWKNFYGIMRFTKEDRRYEAYVAQVQDNIVHTARAYDKWYDVQNRFHDIPLGQIQLYIAGYGTNPMPANTNIWFDRLKVYKRNKISEKEVKYIARAGDVIEIDHYTKEITLNGEPYKKELNPSSNLFAMEGNSDITLFPTGVANVELSYRSRWL